MEKIDEALLRMHIEALEEPLAKNKDLVRTSLYRMDPLDQQPTLEEVRKLRTMMADIQALSWCLREDLARISTKRTIRRLFRKK